MGIDGLKKLIREKAPLAWEEIPITDLAGKTVAVDTSITVYQMQSVAKGYSKDPTDDRKFQQLIMSRAEFFKRIKAIPVMVLDGEPPQCKNITLERRRKAQKEGYVGPTQRHFDMTREIMEANGIQCVIAPSEAESQCAHMTRDGICYAAITEDGDSLTFGATHVIFGFKASAKTVVRVSIEKVLQGLELDMDQFIDLCILLTCDYCDTIPRLKNKLELIREHGTIEAIMHHKKIDPKSIPNFDFQTARREFNAPRVDKVILNPPQPNPKFISDLKKSLAKVTIEDGIAFDD